MVKLVQEGDGVSCWLRDKEWLEGGTGLWDDFSMN